MAAHSFSTTKPGAAQARPIRQPVVVVAGATSGLGARLATHFRKHGAHVIGIGTNPLRGLPLGVLWVDADLCRAQGRVDGLETIRRTAGRIDILINNGACALPVETGDGGLALAGSGSLDLSAAILLCTDATALLESSARPLILNVVPAPAKDPAPLYRSSKCGFGSFSKTLRTALTPTAIRVVTVLAPSRPDITNTDVTNTDVAQQIMERVERGETDIDLTQPARRRGMAGLFGIRRA